MDKAKEGLEGEEDLRTGIFDMRYLRFLLVNYMLVAFFGVLFGKRLFSYNVVVIEGGKRFPPHCGYLPLSFLSQPSSSF